MFQVRNKNEQTGPSGNAWSIRTNNRLGDPGVWHPCASDLKRTLNCCLVVHHLRVRNRLLATNCYRHLYHDLRVRHGPHGCLFLRATLP